MARMAFWLGCIFLFPLTIGLSLLSSLLSPLSSFFFISFLFLFLLHSFPFLFFLSFTTDIPFFHLHRHFPSSYFYFILPLPFSFLTIYLSSSPSLFNLFSSPSSSSASPSSPSSPPRRSIMPAKNKQKFPPSVRTNTGTQKREVVCCWDVTLGEKCHSHEFRNLRFSYFCFYFSVPFFFSWLIFFVFFFYV